MVVAHLHVVCELVASPHLVTCTQGGPSSRGAAQNSRNAPPFGHANSKAWCIWARWSQPSSAKCPSDCEQRFPGRAASRGYPRRPTPVWVMASARAGSRRQRCSQREPRRGAALHLTTSFRASSIAESWNAPSVPLPSAQSIARLSPSERPKCVVLLHKFGV